MEAHQVSPILVRPVREQLEHDRLIRLLQAKLKKFTKLNRWKTFITTAAQTFATAETALSNARIAGIQTSCQDLFGRLVRGGPDVQLLVCGS